MGRHVEADTSLANSLNRILTPVFGPASDVVGTLQARDRLLQASIAMLQSRLADGKLPAGVPVSIGKAAIDPFDGNPLRYRLKGSGFLLYSIGADRQDNGGKGKGPGRVPQEHYDEVIEFK